MCAPDCGHDVSTAGRSSGTPTLHFEQYIIGNFRKEITDYYLLFTQIKYPNSLHTGRFVL